MFKKVLLSTFIILSGFICANASELEFAQVSDVKYDLTDKELDKYLYFLTLSIKKNEPDFTVFLGNNISKSEEDNIIGFMRAVYPIRFPYYIVLGSDDAHKLNGIDKETYWDIVTAFNRNQKDGKQYYYFKPNSDFICVVLDDTSNFARSSHGQIPDEQIVWLDNLLAKNPKKLFIIFHHAPLLPPRNEYRLSMLNTERYESLLKKYPNIVAISSGNYGQSAITTDESGVKHISAPAFKDMPHSYQMIKIKYDKDTYKSPKDVEITVTDVKV